MECDCCFSPSSPLSLPPVPPPLLHQKAEEDVFAFCFGQRQDVGKNLLLRTHHWWDSAGGTPSPQRARRGSGLTGAARLPDPGPGMTPSWTALACSDHARNRPGGRPKSHHPLRHPTGLKQPPGTHGSWRDAQAAQHRYYRKLASNPPLPPPKPSEAPPAAAAPYGPRWSLMSRRRADPAQSARRVPLPPAPWAGSCEVRAVCAA